MKPMIPREQKLYKRVSNTRVEIGNAGSCRSNPAIVIRSGKKESRSSRGKKINSREVVSTNKHKTATKDVLLWQHES
jgi:hypothetical protein